MSNELTSDPTRVSQFTTRDVATDSACVPRPTGPARTAVDMLSRPADFDNDGIGEAMSSEIDDDAWDVCHVIQSGAPATLDSATDTMALSALHDANSYYVDQETRRNTIFNVLQSRRFSDVRSTRRSKRHQGAIGRDLPQTGEEIVKLPEMDYCAFESALRSHEIVSIAVIYAMDELQLATSSTLDPAVADAHGTSTYDQHWDALRASPFFDLLREFADVFPEEVPPSLPEIRASDMRLT
ncbi:hypothetical protein AC1031_011982 [Aphanomyces cochlioides]|nr:hypothetical protein AC1031_011982 [Aphanomyces cochlioides]